MEQLEGLHRVQEQTAVNHMVTLRVADVEGAMDTHRRRKLLFVCGKMAAGKSTLSTELAAREDAVHLAQDDLLVALYPGEFTDLAAFVKYSSRLQSVLTPHIVALLMKGVSVVLDFPANTKRQRAWFRQLIEMSGPTMSFISSSHLTNFVSVN